MAYDQTQLDQIFNQALGRNGTDAEHTFLKSYVDQGFISPAEIGHYLSGTPEALKNRLAQQQDQFGGILSQGNGQILSDAAKAANAQFAQNGRQFSTGQTAQTLQAGQQIAAQQSPLLAQFYGQGQQGLNDSYYQQSAGALNWARNQAEEYKQRQWSIEDYYRQKNDYDSYLNSANNRAKWGAVGSLAGAGLGAYLGGPKGRMLGAAVGSQAGGSLGSLWG